MSKADKEPSPVMKPKYQKLKDYLIDTIKQDKLKTGEQIASENELVDRFAISRHTVRQAIGELVNEGWLYRVHGSGTFVDRRPDIKRVETKTIGVITTYMNDYIFPSIIRGIDGVLSFHGFNIVLCCTYNQHEKERQCIESLISQGIDGLIVEPTKSALPNPNIDLYSELSRMGIPVIFIHGCYKELEYSYVVEDDKEAGYISTKHLVELGHEKIGGVFKIDDIQGHLRFSGFQKALKEKGLQTLDQRILWFATDEADEKFCGDGTKRLISLLTECTAIVCYNEQIALKLLDLMRQKGINVPEDISLVSFDDSPLAVSSEVKLTTVAHPKEKLGEVAADSMLKMINRTKDYHAIKMRPELIVRGSTNSI